MSHLKIQRLQKTFGTQTVLKDIDLVVAGGAFVSLLGPSGCGKTTLLRIIAGLESASAGTVRIGERDVTGLPPEKRNVALMFQSYALLPHMTVLENVRFPLRMKRQQSTAGQRRRAREALELVQLENLGGRYPRQLSGGQQQRVALARAIVAEPDLLLLDEPLSNLDARLREDMQVELKRLHETLGLTTVFVTHDQSEALALADTIVLMHDGRIEQQGSPEEIYQTPRTVFAADFIGGANILCLEVRRREKGWTGVLPGGEEVDLKAHPSLAPGPHNFMLRKEALLFDPEGADTTRLPARLEMQNYLGSVTRSVIEAGGLRLIALTDAKITPKPGDDIAVGWRLAELIPLSE